MTQVTDWFPAKTKPHHIGAYEIQSINENVWFSWWNGKNWNSNWPTAQRACDNRFFGDTRNVKGWRGLATQPVNSHVRISGCGCYRCVEHDTVDAGFGMIPYVATVMIVCGKCGNKRCPYATDHNFDCTGSNESGQKGSRYE